MRGTTIYNVGVLHRDEKTGKLLYLALNQLDCKVQVPAVIMNKMLPSKIEDWNNGVINHYNKHFCLA